MEIMDTWNDISPDQRVDIIKDLIEDTQGRGLSTQEAEGLLNLGRMQIEAEELDKGDQYLKQALFYLKRIREQNLDDPEPKAIKMPAPAQKRPANKPNKGRCSQCKKDRLRFNDDGTGDCPDCGRKFTWDKGRAKPAPPPPDAQDPLPPAPQPDLGPERKEDTMEAPTEDELAALDFSQLDGLDRDGPEDPITPEPQPPDPLPPNPVPNPQDPEPEPPGPAPEPEPDDDDGDDDHGNARPEPGPSVAISPDLEDLLEPTPVPVPAAEAKAPEPETPLPKSNTDEVNALFSDIMLEQKKECDEAAAPPQQPPAPAAPDSGPAVARPRIQTAPKPTEPAQRSAAAQEDPEKRILRMACEKAQEAYERMEAKKKDGADISLVENLLTKSRAAMAQKDYVAALNMSGEALRVIDGIMVPSDGLLEPSPVQAAPQPSMPVAPEAQQVPPHQANAMAELYQDPLQSAGVFALPGQQQASEPFNDPLFASPPSSKADMGIAEAPVFKEDGPSKVFSLDPKDNFASIYEAPRQDASVYDSRGRGTQQQNVYSSQSPEVSPYGGLEGQSIYQGHVEAQPAYAQQPLLTALCYNCNGAIPIYSDQRPLILTCPACGVQVQLD